jgi:hypothetical protein
MSEAERPIGENVRAILAELPDWAQRVITSDSESPPAPTQPRPTDYVGKPAWPALLNAAVVSSFLPRELLANAVSDDGERKNAETAVLRFSETVHEPEGRKWLLTREARAAVLGAAKKEEIDQAVQRTASGFNDPISAALREQLKGPTVNLESLSLPVLEATRIAAGWLRGAAGEAAPNLDELDHAISFRRLLKPFNRMVYPDAKDGTQGQEVRFFGRDSEMKELNDFVGAINPAGFLSRAFSRLSRKIFGAEPAMVVWGIGGVGKTTLIAKFMLDHAEVAAARFPFAYLDFDRPLISARQPARLLAEMCSQVEAQFSAIAEPLRQLKDKVTAIELDRNAEAAMEELETFQLLGPHVETFRTIVDQHISELESYFEFERPFLLIFDTFEIVQYSEKDVRRLETFMRKLTGSENGRGWSRLRLVISGRSKPENFLGGVKDIPLKALDRNGSIDMLVALAKDAGRPIDRDTAERLVAAIVKSLRGPSDGGCQPLCLRLVGEVLRGAKETDGRKLVDGLIAELSLPASGRDTLRGKLIDGILIRRVLEHVADSRVRALADPGLVVRQVTPEVIREVMALGTPRPGSDLEVIDGDTEDWEPWVLSPQEADDIFVAFGREVSIVVRDGKALRHRQDLRREMLPLIKDRRQKRFIRLHQLAHDFFRGRVENNPDDHASRGEAIYHGLWLGIPIEQLDQLWKDVPEFDPRIDPAEFEELPDPQRYVKAKTFADLSAMEIKKLPRTIAIKWLSAKAGDFLDNSHPNEDVERAQAAAGVRYEALDGNVKTAAYLARLVYRTGRWGDTRELIVRHLGDPDQLGEFTRALARGPGLASGEIVDRMSLFRTWVTIAAKSGAEQAPLIGAQTLGDALITSGDPITGIELLGYAALGGNILQQQSIGTGIALDLPDRILHAARQVPLDHWRNYSRTLRLAVLSEGNEAADLMAAYLTIAQYPPREEETFATVAWVLYTLYQDNGEEDAARQVRNILDKYRPQRKTNELLTQLWFKEKGRIIEAVRRTPQLRPDVRRIILFDHYDWVRPLGHALERELASERGLALERTLVKQDLIAVTGTGGVSNDGLALVQWASARGNLMKLAAAIADSSERQSFAAADPGGDRTEYPQTVFAIADALLRWHDANLAAIDNDDPSSRGLSTARGSTRPATGRRRR